MKDVNNDQLILRSSGVVLKVNEMWKKFYKTDGKNLYTFSFTLQKSKCTKTIASVSNAMVNETCETCNKKTYNNKK